MVVQACEVLASGFVANICKLTKMIAGVQIMSLQLMGPGPCSPAEETGTHQFHDLCGVTWRFIVQPKLLILSLASS